MACELGLPRLLDQVRSSLARNALLNFLTLLFPLLLAVALIPPIVAGFGVQRFGILALIWGVLGYFVITDFGLGRALTRAVAGRLGTDREGEIPNALVWALILVALVAALLTATLLAVIPRLVHSTLNIPLGYRDETQASFLLLAGSLVLVATSSAFNGYLAGFQRFDLINLAKVFLLSGTLCAPLLGIRSEEPILVSTALMVAVRLAGWCLLIGMCYMATPPNIRDARRRLSEIGHLVSFGGWITVINVSNVLLTYADRWALAALSTLAVVSYYSVPFEIATKIWIIPTAIAAAMFPAFCRVPDSTRPDDAGRLMFFGTAYTMAMSFAATLLVLAVAHEILLLWLGAEFAREGAAVFQVLLVGTFVNAVAHTAATYLQGSGRPQWIALLLLAELPVFVLALWAVIPTWGALGAAFAWTGRVAVDSSALYYLAFRTLPPRYRAHHAINVTFFAAFLSVLIGIAVVQSVFVQAALFVVGLGLLSFLLKRLGTYARQDSSLAAGVEH